eukprot:2143720-Rhodomonas_salina.5
MSYGMPGTDAACGTASGVGAITLGAGTATSVWYNLTTSLSVQWTDLVGQGAVRYKVSVAVVHRTGLSPYRVAATDVSGAGGTVSVLVDGLEVGTEYSFVVETRNGYYQGYQSPREVRGQLEPLPPAPTVRVAGTTLLCTTRY